MKITHQLLLCCVLVISTEASLAQIGKPVSSPKKQPVLIDDTHDKSLKLAKQNRERQQASTATLFTDLSEKQKKCISRIEAARDKKLKQLDAQLVSKKERLAVLKSSVNKNAKLIEQTTCEISKLAIERQKVQSTAREKVKSQLTKSQRAVLERVR